MWCVVPLIVLHQRTLQTNTVMYADLIVMGYIRDARLVTSCADKTLNSNLAQLSQRKIR